MERTSIIHKDKPRRQILECTGSCKGNNIGLRKVSCLIRICILLIPFIVLAALAEPVRGELKCVPWESLVDHLVERSVDLLDLNVCDCPDDIEDMEPSRVIAQFIENTFYLWEEYDIVTDAETTRVCIIMQKPQATRLLAEEAQVLLTGSSLWRESPLLLQNTTASEPLDQPFIRRPSEERIMHEDGSVEPKLVIDSDDRTRITDTTSYPWNIHCSLIIDFPPEPVSAGPNWQGSGCLIGPYTVLTCAHNVYDRKTSSQLEKVTIIPGQTQESEGGNVYSPYGIRESAEVRFHPDFRYGSTAEHEIGSILFDTPFPGINTYLPVELSNSVSEGETVHVAGYPVYVKLGTPDEVLNNWALWDGSGLIAAFSPTILTYRVDTSGGQSGAPVRTAQNHIIGIHAGGDPDALINGGARFGSHNASLVTEWMQWTPGQSEGEDIVVFKDTFTLHFIDSSKWPVVEGATLAYIGAYDSNPDQFILMNGYPYGGDRMESRAIDLSPFSGAVLSYEYKRRQTDWEDDLIFSYWNGLNWIEAHRQSGRQTEMDAYQLITIHLPIDALHADFRLRIRSIGSENDNELHDDWRIDNVTIMGWIGSTVILEETWPEQNADGFKWITHGVEVSTLSENEPSPPYSMNFNTGDALRSLTLDLSNYSRAVLTYYYQRTGGGESPDPGNDFASKYWNGVSYTTLRTHLGSGPDMVHFEKVTVTLPPEAMRKNFRLYFESEGDKIWYWVFDDWFLDDIELRVWR